MKQLLTVLFVTIFLAVPLHASADSPGDARTSLIIGNVYLKAADTNNEWQTVSINMPVMQNDTYWVSEGGKAVIQFFGSSYLRAEQNTEFNVISIDDSSNTVAINLQRGRVYIDREGSPEGSLFEIDAPYVSVGADSSAQFDVNISNNSITEVSVISGSVRIDSASESTRIYAGDMVAVSNSGVAEVSSYIPDDEWISWNTSRIKASYENARVSNAVTVVSRQTFDSGSAFRQVTRPQVSYRQIGVVARPQQPATRAQYHPYKNNGFSQGKNSRNGNIQAFRW